MESTTARPAVVDPDRPTDATNGARQPAEGDAPEPIGTDTEPAEPAEAATADDGAAADRDSRTETRRSPRRWLPDVAAVLGYLAAAMLVFGPLWRDPNGRTPITNDTDATLFRWMMAHSVRVLTHLENPLLSDRMNQPDGISVIANTSVLGLGIPLSPVTMLWGPAVSALVLMVLALAGTATAWYFVFSRCLAFARPAAFAGAALAGFCPGLVSHSVHPNLAVNFMLPLILAAVFRLGTTARPLRAGLVLGLMIAYQVFIGEETLFVTALMTVICLVVWGVQRPREVTRRWRPFLLGSVTAALVALVLVAYPLYVQFTGPGSYQRIPGVQNYGADLLSFVSYSPLSLGGDPDAKLRLAGNYSELNTFYGWPLLIAVLAVVAWLWRGLWVRIGAVAAVVLIALSLGHDIRIDGRYTGVVGPWLLLSKAPLFESMVTGRLGMLAGAALGLIVAAGLTELLRDGARRPLRLGLAAVLIGTMVPLIPRPMPTLPMVQLPVALADGRWRQYLGDNEAVLPVPPMKPEVLASMSWAADTDLGFKVSHSYILAPDPVRGHGWARFSTISTATEAMLNQVAKTGKPARVTPAQRAQARIDLRHRNVGLLTLEAGRPNADALRSTVDELLNQPGQRVGDLWLWDVGQG
ncbi:hypothetical protein ACFFWC_01245 [Plantactinospora siamensis]|uniref:Glycosyl transferase n=1 Tax=Plantactinospora siamensis TaxID=555372 RepID=A0ABV6NTC0_9ACTN